MQKAKKTKSKVVALSPVEWRAARATRINVFEAEPYGWIATSENETEESYHLFCEPYSRSLVCTCADFVFRGNAEPGFECKHIVAVLKFIARSYLVKDYDPQKQRTEIQQRLQAA